MQKNDPVYKFNTTLLIDDNHLDNFINEKMLESTCFSKKILINTNGEIAIQTIHTLISSDHFVDSDVPDIIFVDLNMPVMSGFEFIENFKKIENSKLKKCRIVILTSSIHNQDRVKAKKIDNNILFVNKPLTNDFLLNFPGPSRSDIS